MSEGDYLEVMRMVYDEVTVVVEGAEEEHEIFTDYLVEREYLKGVAEDAVADGYETEVYIITHEHEIGDCECVQYLTDHHPQYVFPRDANQFLAD